MKYKVRIDNRQFEVEITNLHARPIIATVDGEEIEIWPEETRARAPQGTLPSPASQMLQNKTRVASSPVPARNGRPGVAAAPSASADAKYVRAPIPGVVVSVSVQPGDQVAVGQELCAIEAMKMKNAIRSGRAGRVASVGAVVGRHIKHHDVLLEFED
jgi:biotin carboxyl carrier protein